jgi:hypothetical protein
MTTDPSARAGVSRRGFLAGAGAGVGMSLLGASGALANPLGGLATGLSRTVGATDVLRMARVFVTGPEEAALVLGAFDDTHRVFDDGSIEVLLWPGDLARLTASNLRFDITVEDVVARDERVMATASAQADDEGGRLPGQVDDYRTLRDFEDDLLGLVARFGDQARLIVLPERSLEGRSVLGIEIADDVHASDGRPVWYMDGLHHAREWPSGELTLMFAFELLENPEGDERIAGLRRDTRTILVPVVNPDGFSWSRDALVQVSDPNASLPLIVAGLEAYWRKNRRGLVDQAMVPHVQRNVTAYGVDPNRNYSARWGGPGASGEPVLQDHRGEYPFSEPEARNVAALLRERQPIALNSNHTYTGLVLRPWGHTGGDGRFTPDEAVLRDLGAAMCAHNGYENWHSIDLYATTGTTVDWGYAALGALSYTFEIGFSNFHPPYAGDDGVLHHYRLNREAFILLGETARFQHVEHRVWDRDTGEYGATASYATHARIVAEVVDGDGEPLPAELTAERTTRIPLGSAADEEWFEEASRVTSAAADGRIDWHLPPSTTPTARERGETESWLVTVEAGGETVTREVAVDRGETVTLEPIRIGEPPRDPSEPAPGPGRGRGRGPGDVPANQRGLAQRQTVRGR